MKNNVVETIVDSDGRFCFNEKHLEQKLDHKHVRVATVKYISGQRIHRYQLVEKQKKQSNRIFIRK